LCRGGNRAKIAAADLLDSAPENRDIPQAGLMKKKEIFGDTLKEQLDASSRDRMLHFVLLDGSIRGALLHGTKLVNEMRANHQLGVLETLVLGHGYMGALLMSSNLKGADRIGVQIECDGPVAGIDVEANSFGEVRGYLYANPIPVTEPPESFDLKPFVGSGRMTVTRFLEKAKQPYTGQISLKYGNLAQDLAYYSTVSDQIPSAFSLSIKFDAEGRSVGAGGLMAQALPGAADDDLIKLVQVIELLPSIGEAFAAGRSAEAFLMAEFADYRPQILEHRRIAFMCHCSRKKFGGYLRQLPLADLEELVQDEPTVLTCRKCNTRYEYSKNEIQAIYRDAAESRS
jgi:molecular chaperone Hsp33